MSLPNAATFKQTLHVTKLITMKQSTKNALAAFATLALTFVLTNCSAPVTQGADAKQAPTAVNAPIKVDDAPQQVTVVVDDGFKPDKLTVKAGHPVLLTFDTKNRGCAKTVVFKSLGITKELTDGVKTTLTFTPTQGGTVDFACGMDMYKGAIAVE